MNSFLNRIKFLFCKKGELYSFLEHTLGFAPHNLSYYDQALTHRSLGLKNKDNKHYNNERLEFLGDAVIETVISDILYHKYPTRDEGFLSTMRSKLVERKNLGRLAKEIHLDKFIKIDLKFPQHEGHNSYIGGNAFEALVGAIYLDRGYKPCQKFINRLIEQGYINMAKTARVEENYKSVILEWGQKHHVDIKIVSIWEDIPTRDRPPFCSAVMIEGRVAARGKGYSKKESHQIASRKAMLSIRRTPAFERSLLQMHLVRCVIEDLLPDVRQKSKLTEQLNAESNSDPS